MLYTNQAGLYTLFEGSFPTFLQYIYDIIFSNTTYVTARRHFLITVIDNLGCNSTLYIMNIHDSHWNTFVQEKQIT